MTLHLTLTGAVFFFQNILHILRASFTSEETGDQSNLLASLFFQSQEHTS